MHIFIVKIKIPSMSKGQKPIGHADADDVGTQSIIVYYCKYHLQHCMVYRISCCIGKTVSLFDNDDHMYNI